jgi:serine protease
MADDNMAAFDRRSFLQATGAVGATAAFGGLATAASGDGGSSREDQIIVNVSQGASLASVEGRIASASAIPDGFRTVKRNDVLGYVLIEPEPSVSVYDATSQDQVMAAIEDQAGVKSTERQQRVEYHLTPDDARFSDMYAPQLVNAPAAWDETLGTEEITVSVIDSGTDYTHSDLEQQFGELKGKDFGSGDDDPMPEGSGTAYMHGTHTAGTIGATTNNGTGVAGMSNCRLLAAKLSGGASWTTAVADALQWSADQGADVVNMSIGVGESDTIKSALGYAANNDVLMFASAGNDGSRGVGFPASDDRVVCVSAVDENEELASFSQYGPNVEITGPGVDVLSTVPDESYDTASGTSMSSPSVAGVAALAKAVAPDISADQLRAKLKETARDIGLGEEEQGAGIADAGALVAALAEDGGNEAPTADFTTSPSAPTTADTVTFDASASGDGDGSIATSAWDLGDGTQKQGESVTHSYATAGDYTVSLTVTDDDGATDSKTTTVSVAEDGGDENQAPSASFDLSSGSVDVGDAVSADASASSDPDGSVVSYSWQWGDGATGSGVSASHSYGSAGDYTVTLTVEDDGGLTDSASETVTVESSGGSECGSRERTTTKSGSLSGWWDASSYTVTTDLDDPCSLSLSLSGPSSADFDLYVTTDGREPTTDDYDRKSISANSQESVEFAEGVDANSEFGVLVDAYSGSGSYDLTVVEQGTGGSGGGGGNEAPTAVASADATAVDVGERVSFDAADSSDPDGRVASYDWSFGDGASASGGSVSHSYGSAGDYTATLTVTDDDGATATDTVTVSVTDDSESCGGEGVSSSAEGSLAGWWDDARFAWTPDTSEPCQVTVSLSGPSSADFDLFVAKDREPTTRDYDKRSISPTSEEAVVFDDVDADTACEILVDAYSGSGSFTVTVEESGN